MKDRLGGWQLIALYLVCYLLWFLFSASTVWTMLQLRNALLGLLPVIGPWLMGAVDKFGFLFMGLVALTWIIFIEDHLRSGIEANRFWPRVRRIALIQVVALAVAYGLLLLPLIV